MVHCACLRVHQLALSLCARPQYVFLHILLEYYKLNIVFQVERALKVWKGGVLATRIPDFRGDELRGDTAAFLGSIKDLNQAEWSAILNGAMAFTTEKVKSRAKAGPNKRSKLVVR